MLSIKPVAKVLVIYNKKILFILHDNKPDIHYPIGDDFLFCFPNSFLGTFES